MIVNKIDTKKYLFCRLELNLSNKKLLLSFFKG